MMHPGRNGNKYRFGFQGQEMDNEVKGTGNSINFKYRMHDPRIGRFFAVDPLAKKYPYNSPYAFSENRLIDGVELEGLEYVFTADGKLRAKFGDDQTILVASSSDIIDYQTDYISKTELLKKSKKMSQANSKIQSNISTDIFNHYIKATYELYNDKISIETDYNYPKGKQPAATSHSAQAFWLGGNTGAIALNPDATEVIDKKWNLLSDLYHEHLHNKLSSEDKKYSNAQEEALVYVNQVAHREFKNTTKDYKEKIRGNFTNNLNKLIGGAKAAVANGDDKAWERTMKFVRKAAQKYSEETGEKLEKHGSYYY